MTRSGRKSCSYTDVLMAKIKKFLTLMIHSFTSWSKHVCLKKRSQKTATEFREDDTFAYKANAHYKYDAKDQVIQIIF